MPATEPSTAAPAAPPARATAPTAVAAAVLLATAPADDGGAAALAPLTADETVVERLLGQLRSLGVAEFHVLGRPDGGLGALEARHPDVTVHVGTTPAEDLETVARLAREGAGGLLIAQAEVVLHREALAGIVVDPRLGTAALNTGRKLARPFAHRIRMRRGRIVSAGSPFHATRDPNGTFLGVLKVAPADRLAFAEVAERLVPLRAQPSPAWLQQLEVVKPGAWRIALGRSAARRAERVASGLGDEVEDEVHAEAAALRSEFMGEPEGGEEDHDRGDPAHVELSPEDDAELARRVAAAREDVVALLLVGLVRADVPVGIGRLRGFAWDRPLSAAGLERARERLASADEERVLLASAVKASDGFFTTFFVSPYSRYIARWCARHGLTPNQVTTFSMALGVLAAAAFAQGDRPWMVAGALLLQAAFTFDCVDGQLARYSRRFSRLGAWLDSIFDRSKEYAVFAGLALGASGAGADPWLLACLAISLQTSRHFVDFSYPIAQQQAIARVVRPPLEEVGDGLTSGLPAWLGDAHPAPGPKRKPRPGAPAARPGLLARWRRAGSGPKAQWAKKVLAFPIGERFALISLTAALFDARVTFWALLTWGTVATSYIVAGRVLRSVRSKRAALGPQPGDHRLEAFRDDGPLVRLIGRVAGVPEPLRRVLTGRMRWAVPPALRAVELFAITALAAGAGDDALPAAFALLCAIAFRHYDNVYRQRQAGEHAGRIVELFGLGWDGRLLLTAVLVLVGAAPAGLWVMAAALAILFVGEAVHGWATYTRPQGVLIDDEEQEAE